MKAPGLVKPERLRIPGPISKDNLSAFGKRTKGNQVTFGWRSKNAKALTLLALGTLEFSEKENIEDRAEYYLTPYHLWARIGAWERSG